jgi:serpin B
MTLVCAACAACDTGPHAAPPSTPSTPPTTPPSTPPAPSHDTPATSASSPRPAPSVEDSVAPPAASVSVGERAGLARSGNAFAFDLYAKLRAQRGNLAFSPFSITTALTMAWAGAHGTTAAQMARVLHVEGQDARVLDLEGAQLAAYATPGTRVTLRVANRLFAEKNYAFEPAYMARLAKAFGAPMETLDFKQASEPARVHINDWVAGVTHDRIKDLIPPMGVNDQTRLALVNAVYFLGDWELPFANDATSPAPFFTAKGVKKDVPTMRQTATTRFAATDGVKVLELNYEASRLAMTFVLPDAVDGLDPLEARLSPAALDRWIAASTYTKVSVALPRLEIAPAEALSLGTALTALGMPDAFDRQKADFTGIANPPSPDDRLVIDRVFHKAFVKVDEKGTEAAAATAVLMATAGAAPDMSPPKEFTADHPFLFFLRDTESKAILFMGRVSDPALTGR